MIIEALNSSSLFIAQGERIFLFGLGGGGGNHIVFRKNRGELVIANSIK